MAEATRIPILFIELGYDSGTQRYCTADDAVTWNGQTWIGAARILDVSTKDARQSTEATSWELTFSGIPVAIVSQALQEPVSGRPWRLWVNEYAPGASGRTFVQTLHSDAGVFDSVELQDDAADLLG
jgi:hypothetical protein